MNKKIVTGHYNDTASVYNELFYTSKKEYSPLIERQELMLDLLDNEVFSQKPRILDIGCGPGEMLVELSKRGSEIWGIDISDEMIKLAKGKIKKKNENIHLESGDIESLTFVDGFFDVVIAAGVIEYLENDTIWIKEISRVLKPNGILIINITNHYAVRRLTLSIFNRIKRNIMMRSIMNFIKSAIFRKGSINYFPFTPRTHSPFKFDVFLHRNGYTKIAHRYFDVSIFPYPFDTLFSCIVNRIRGIFRKYSSRNVVFFGCGYIVKVKKQTIGRT
ncbi:methyltransferase domain-containing protein [Candidatus Latescibacterota bacterium]